MACSMPGVNRRRLPQDRVCREIKNGTATAARCRSANDHLNAVAVRCLRRSRSAHLGHASHQSEPEPDCRRRDAAEVGRPTVAVEPRSADNNSPTTQTLPTGWGKQSGSLARSVRQPILQPDGLRACQWQQDLRTRSHGNLFGARGAENTSRCTVMCNSGPFSSLLRL